ncbi:methyl-accepting chemotaxis protein [Paraburkholderia phymatum]|uniref:methyl-accepting chemotaxis protein n=1 Tax=Paraburkholderia phymatum TaxID=148447 RepID=UPI003179CB0F
MRITNLKIGTRLGLGFGLVLLLMVVLIVVSLSRIAEVGDLNDQLIKSDWVKAQAANAIDGTMRSNARRTMELIVTNGQNQREEIFRRIADSKESINRDIQTLDTLVSTPEGKTLLSQFKQNREQYVASFSKVGQLVRDGKEDEARQVVLTETLPRLDLASQDIRKLVDWQATLVLSKGGQTHDEIDSTRNLMIGLGILAVLLGAGFGVWVTRSITRPLNEAVRIAQAVSKGDLTSRIEAHTADEVGQLLQALKTMNSSLADMVSRIHTGAETISTASGQIAAGNTDLSSRTEEQAASLEETAASMEELTATVRQNTESAKQGNMLAANASEIAARGGEVVGRVVHTMREISDSSTKVADIISTIEGIAFQTNILALNAAVEAARAGEQGRGFAVVAGEVRSLAQRAATAAKEIKDLINESVDRVTSGTEQVDEAGRTINEVVSAVRRVTDLMGEIAAASNEQHKGIEQVNSAVVQMDQVTQQNAALVEQASAAAQSMAEQARGLRDAVSVFKVSTAAAIFAGTASTAPRKPTMPTPKAPVHSAPRPAAKPALATEMVKQDEQSTESWETS